MSPHNQDATSVEIMKFVYNFTAESAFFSSTQLFLQLFSKNLKAQYPTLQPKIFQQIKGALKIYSQ